jgi:hypothetical protein
MAKGKDYADIAAKKMYRPADIKRQPRFLVYSRNKKGKTTFIMSAEKSPNQHVLLLDPEHGSDEMKQKNPHVWPIDRWEDMDDAYEFARHINKCPFKACPAGKDHPFTWVGVDGLTKMANLALKYVMRVEEEKSLTRQPGLVQQRDYGKSGELMKDLLTKYHNLPQGIVFTSQERQVEAVDSEEDEEYDDLPSAYVPDLPKGVRGPANAIVDVIGRIYVVRTQDEPPKKERRLWVGESARYDTGYRSDFVLPDYVRNPTVPKLVTLMRTGAIPTRKK